MAFVVAGGLSSALEQRRQLALSRCVRSAAVVRGKRAVLVCCTDGGDADFGEDAGSDGDISREGRSDSGTRDSEFDVADDPLPAATGDQNELYDMIKSIPPNELMSRFVEDSPKDVQDAVKVTLRNMLGSLPPMMFNVNVRTVTANLVQLLQSCLMNGYMLRNVEYRLSIKKSLDSTKLLKGDAPDPTTEIVGGTAVITNEDGTTSEVPADEFLNDLRAQVETLKNELKESQKGSNELVKFLAQMGPENMEALTSNAGEEVVDAMKKVVASVTESQGFPEQPESVVESATIELGQLLFWLMIVGYFMREAEVRLDMKRSLEKAPEPKFLMEDGDEAQKGS